MKTKLLIALLMTSVLSFGQDPITSFYPENGSTYAILFSASGIDQSASGANAVWSFTDLSPVGYSSDDNNAPTSQEVSDFPGTTIATRNTASVNLTTTTSNIYSKNVSNEVSITGISNPQVTLNFATNNAKLGTFPLNYGYSFTDNLAGTYSYDIYSGTLSGTITTSVDAYGLLTLTSTGLADMTSQPVTRLKSVQVINLNYGFVPNVGTINQTVYSYYIAGNASPAFRTSTTTVNVPLLSINQTAEQLERLVGNLGVNENVSSNAITIYPNPTEDLLNINNPTSQNIIGIAITDISGRIVMQSKGGLDTISIGHLQKGMYIATITTASGSFTQKIMKK